MQAAAAPGSGGGGNGPPVSTGCSAPYGGVYLAQCWRSLLITSGLLSQGSLGPTGQAWAEELVQGKPPWCRSQET